MTTPTTHLGVPEESGAQVRKSPTRVRCKVCGFWMPEGDYADVCEDCDRELIEDERDR